MILRSQTSDNHIVNEMYLARHVVPNKCPQLASRLINLEQISLTPIVYCEINPILIYILRKEYKVYDRHKQIQKRIVIA